MNKTMEEVYVVAACRTPIGKMGGALKSLTVADLSAIVFQEILNRGGITADMVDEIVMGETRPSAAIHNVARHAALMANFPYEVTAYTIQQACSSGMAAIQCSMNKIMVGMADVVIAGGVAEKTPALVRHEEFAREFGRAAGAHGDFLSRVPVWLNRHPQSGLWGTADEGAMHAHGGGKR